MELFVWILIAGLVVWFVLIPALALWIAVHVLGEEEDAEIAAVTPRNPSSAVICAVFHSVKFN